MRNNETERENFSGEVPQRAVSIYGQNESVDDFPVLKAFQQYVDAEQEKARKRIVGISILFGVFLLVVITVFMFLLHSFNSRNQLLSDRLVEYAFSEAKRQQALNPNAAAPAKDDAAIKAMTEVLSSIQKQMQDKTSATISGHNTPQTNEDSEQIRKAKALLEIERQRLSVEKERLHQIEVDRQRRKLYPEFYNDNTDSQSRKVEKASRPPTNTISDDDIRDIIREAYPETETHSDGKRTAAQSRMPEVLDKAEDDKNAKGTEETVEEAIEYFKDDDYAIPLDVKGSDSKLQFTVPVE